MRRAKNATTCLRCGTRPLEQNKRHLALACLENYGVAARVFPACSRETSEERYYVFALRHTPA